MKDKSQHICEKCGEDAHGPIIFNTDPLTLAQYFSDVEYRNERNKGDSWCLKCARKERVASED